MGIGMCTTHGLDCLVKLTCQYRNGPHVHTVPVPHIALFPKKTIIGHGMCCSWSVLLILISVFLTNTCQAPLWVQCCTRSSLTTYSGASRMMGLAGGSGP